MPFYARAELFRHIYISFVFLFCVCLLSFVFCFHFNRNGRAGERRELGEALSGGHFERSGGYLRLIEVSALIKIILVS